MSWQVWVLDGVPETDYTEAGPWHPPLPVRYAPPAVGASQAYLDWEYGLVAQLERGGTDGLFVI